MHAKPISELDGCPLVNDKLSLEAEDVICGVYKVYTGVGYCFMYLPDGANRFSSANGGCFLAAPRHRHGINRFTIGETWYQRRLKIQDGGQPKREEDRLKIYRHFFSDVSDDIFTNKNTY